MLDILYQDLYVQRFIPLMNKIQVVDKIIVLVLLAITICLNEDLVVLDIKRKEKLIPIIDVVNKEQQEVLILFISFNQIVN